MPFSYYEHLSGPDQATYRRSDAVRAIRLHEWRSFQPLTQAIGEALTEGALPAVEAAAQALCDAVTSTLQVEPVWVEVLAVRPKSLFAELHGLYRRGDAGPPRIQVWMRTAERAKVVAFKTFVRTVVHELVHHLDVTFLGLPRSFHTSGFYGRESSLVHQLVPAPLKG